MKNKLCALALISMVGMVTGNALAQPSPPGLAVPPNTPGIAGDKSTRAGEARKEMRPAVGVKAPGGDAAMAPEGGAIGTDRAAVAGERRAETRDARRPGKAKPMPGGTPK